MASMLRRWAAAAWKAYTHDAAKPSVSLEPCTAHQVVLDGTLHAGQPQAKDA